MHVSDFCLLLNTSERRSEILEGFEMLCWRRMEKFSWADRVENEELRDVKEKKNILQTIKRRKAKGIGHILRKNCLIKHVIEEKIE